MPLADTLRAMRGVMLYAEEIPENISERKDLVISFAPELTKEELRDLLKIPPEKFKIYTTTIFTGEAKVLQNHFKMTLKFLETHLNDYNLFALTRSLQKFKPWRGNESKKLADNFKEYVQKELSVQFAEPRLITELAELEYQNMLVKKHPVLFKKENLINSVDLEKLEVAELLEQRVSLSPTAKFSRFSFDLVEAYKYFYANSHSLPEEYNNQETYAVCARTLSGRPVWTKISEHVFKFLSINQNFSIGKLAEVWIASASEETLSEEALFENFFTFFRQLIHVPVLCLFNSHEIY